MVADFLRKYVLRDLYQPHTWWGFDGPYTRIQLDDGSSFVLIMSSVWRAKTRPHLCHVGYYPTPSQQNLSRNEVQGFACDFYPDEITATRRRADDRDGVASFTLSAAIPDEKATFRYDVDAYKQSYNHRFKHPTTNQDLDIEVTLSKATPHSLLGPMWLARFMPIPLKWHVFSTRSRVDVQVKGHGQLIMHKSGLAHQEKNWGIGFPSAWIWCQGFATSTDRGSLAIAGGKVNSFLSSFMVAYRSPSTHRNWSFGPASTMSLFGVGPFVSLSKCSSEAGEVHLECSNPLLGRKIVISAHAPVDTFKVMSAPLPKGHTPEYCHESFVAKYKVTCYERWWIGQWKQVEETVLDNSALEFGGDWSHWWTQGRGSQSKEE